MDSKNKIAFFDFDGTLIKGDSFLLFSYYNFGKAKVWKIIFKFLPNLVKCKLRLCSKDLLKERIFSELFSGMNYTTFKFRGEDFARILDNHINGTIFEKAKCLSSEGIDTVIVSASIEEWIRPWAIMHGFKDVISTKVEIDKKNNILTGHFSTPNCNRLEKVRRIKQLYPGIKQYEIWVYGDGKGDQEMLLIANYPCPVKKYRSYI